jgi:hypothetical protein
MGAANAEQPENPTGKMKGLGWQCGYKSTPELQCQLSCRKHQHHWQQQWLLLQQRHWKRLEIQSRQ